MVDADATLRAAERVVGLLLKLYAGGSKAKSDIIELLRRNPDADLGQIQQACRRYRLRGLGALLRELER